MTTAWRRAGWWAITAITVGLVLPVGGQAMRSKDAYILTSGHRWTFGTAKGERVVALRDGKLTATGLRATPADGRTAAIGVEHEVFSLGVPDGKSRITSADGGWELVEARRTRLKQGELQLDIVVRRKGLQATRTWVVYPGSSVVREWVNFANVGSAPLQVMEPSFLDVALRLPGAAQDPAGFPVDFHWMTGGENQPGSWVLKSEALPTAKARTFDSYEPFVVDPNAPKPGGDGVDTRIMLNDRQVWPASGWGYSADASDQKPFEASVDVQAGDRLIFQVNMHGWFGFDTTAFDPTIAYDDGETHIASKEFSGVQGEAGWRYQFIQGDKFVDLRYYPVPRQWRLPEDNATGTPFVGPGTQHPHADMDSARVWTAPKAGHLRITGLVCNTGNSPSGAGGYGPRMGSGTYAPWTALHDRKSGLGMFISWDFMGHWTSEYARGTDGSVTCRLRVAGHRQTLKPGQSMATPRAMTGLFVDDLDSAGNECLDWQYRYLWDYTREPWFPAIRMLGYWMYGTGWGQEGVGWTGGGPDWGSTFRKVFRVADLMSACGADVYHRDWGWWDRAGDWTGPDFRGTGNYLRKHDMGQLIYAFLYTVDPKSKVAREHPEWVLGGSTLDMSRPEVVDFMVGQLETFYQRWGAFEWRNDSMPTSPNGADDTPMVGQDAGLREVIRRFLDKHPDCAFQAVNGGGNNAGIDYARLASTVSFSDGAVGVIRNYWASLILPPDKTSDIPDIWNPDKYDKAVWRGLLCINFDMTGDTWDRAKVEGLRELIDIYHYLKKQGVVGRWVRVYRPAVTGDDPTMYFQRMSGDGKRGIIIPKRTAAGPVTVKPRGLHPAERYVVSFQESQDRQERLGSDLMSRGIEIARMAPGELIYLNLPLHPGSKLDKTPPTAPRAVTVVRAENMGYPGVEVAWKPGTDNNWVSGYEVLRDGKPVAMVAHGSYLFDHSAGADLAARYEVKTVDGAGNRSRSSVAPSQAGAALARATVIDDAPGAGFRYTGEWKHDAGAQPTHAGTLSTSGQKGATAELAFEGGREVLWFAKLGATCGKASVSLDGRPGEVVDLYSADDIWGVCVWRGKLTGTGSHALTITVLGQKAERAAGTLVNVDGVRVEK